MELDNAIVCFHAPSRQTVMCNGNVFSRRSLVVLYFKSSQIYLLTEF